MEEEEEEKEEEKREKEEEAGEEDEDEEERADREEKIKRDIDGVIVTRSLRGTLFLFPFLSIVFSRLRFFPDSSTGARVHA